MDTHSEIVIEEAGSSELKHRLNQQPSGNSWWNRIKRCLCGSSGNGEPDEPYEVVVADAHEPEEGKSVPGESDPWLDEMVTFLEMLQGYE